MGKKKSTRSIPSPVETRNAPTQLPSPTPVPLPGISIASFAMYANAWPLSVIEAAGISAVRRCVTLICNAIAGAPWVEWNGKTPLETPQTQLVKRPAVTMTRREWVWRVVSMMALDDSAHLLMRGGVDDEGIPGSLLPLPREAIAPAGFVDPFGVFPPTAFTVAGIPGTVSGENVVVLRSAFWPGVPPHLAGILQMARSLMLSAYTSDSYQAKYWQSGGSPTTVITTEQELTDPQAVGIAQRWKDRRQLGPDFPAVLGKGAHAEPWGADAASDQASAAKREMMIEICNLFGVPARYLNVQPSGGSGAMTYANLNDEGLSLERFTLSGFVDPIQDCISDLLPDPRHMTMDLVDLTKGGQEARARAWQMATGGKPWMMPSEVRPFEGLPPNDDIDTMDDAQVKGSEAAAESFANRAAGDTGKPVTNEAEPEKEPANA